MNLYDQVRAPDQPQSEESQQSTELENSCDIGFMYEDNENPDI